ncbi:MAG: MBL fold metallo-hydrolase [Alistipes sp.]|nr:MBL fold metallo-hydrolase [Alistipes sp.]
MKHPKTTIALRTFAAAADCGAPLRTYPTDTIPTRTGSPVAITFFKHASLAIEYGGRRIYVDPIGQYADYASLPKADLILVTHSHYDHLDRAAVEALSNPETIVVCDRTSAEELGGKVRAMTPGEKCRPCDFLTVEAVAAYNTSADRQQFHPRERRDCGYLLEIGGSRIYIAGDGENTPEMKALRDIDIAFLPVNQPYTMTVDQAVDAVKAIRPALFYPYHYGEVEEKTDLDRLVRELEGVTEVRIRPME